jgi:hypothetical protein
MERPSQEATEAASFSCAWQGRYARAKDHLWVTGIICKKHSGNVCRNVDMSKFGKHNEIVGFPNWPYRSFI